ncbi:MAG: DNA repair protein RecO [Bacteroidota bacterium]
MLIKTRAIVFRTHKYGETSLIAELYTEHYGLRKYVINGVRSAKARTKASLLQVMSLLDIVAYERENRDLNRLKEIRPAQLYSGIPFDVRKGTVGLFWVEIARKSIREREENAALFHFLWQSFLTLDETTTSLAHYPLCYLIELSRYLGFYPSGTYRPATPFFDLQEGDFVSTLPNHPAYLTEELSLLLAAILRTSLAQADQITSDRSQRRALLSQLIRYYQLHLEGMGTVHSHEVLQSLL